MEIKKEPVHESEKSQETEMEGLNQCVDGIYMKVNQLEEKLNEVEKVYASSSLKHSDTPKGGPIVKNKDMEKFIANFKKRQHVSGRGEAAAAKRMQKLMNQFGTILDQLIQHEWAGPFVQPVDVIGLGLHDYYEVIEKPMDFSTVKFKMEAKDGYGYKDVHEICADVRLIFKNAMTYNGEKDDVYVMAKTLLDKFETKWLQLLPKFDEEEKRRKEEEADMEQEIQFAQEAACGKMARDIRNELKEADLHLEEIKQRVLQKYRKITTEEKKRLGSAISQFSLENINRALEIIAGDDPDSECAGETLDINIDALSESTLWKLKFFVKDTLQAQMKKSSASSGGRGNNNLSDIKDSRKRKLQNRQ